MTWVFNKVYEGEGCVDFIRWEWGLQDGVSEYEVQDCPTKFVKEKTFRDRAPRRVWVKLYIAGNMVEAGYWDIRYR